MTRGGPALKKLHISSSLAISADDFVTSTQAILAKKGSGKSYTASVIAEELLATDHQVVVLDPTGAWWGLRSSADGKDEGYPIAVLGGEHADVDLEAAAGELVADAIASEHFSAILDLSLFRKGEALRFCATFLETLYRRNRTALHLFIDEADVVAPQRTFGPEDAKALGATEDIVRRGRIRGIGCTLITQRAQVLNKNVLSQVDMLTTLRMNHPKDIGAIDDWVAVHGDVKLAKKMIESLPVLPIGTAWMWAPAQELFASVPIRRRQTFDSGRTPKAGERAAAPKVLAPVDIARLGATIAATAEQVKANDPKVLKARVAELERQLVARPAAAPAERVEVPILRADEIERLRQAVAAFEAKAEVVDRALAEVDVTLELVGSMASDLKAAIELGKAHGIVARTSASSALPTPRPPAPRGSGPGDAKLAGGERKILTALAQYAPSSRTKQQVAILTGYAHTGGGFNNYVGSLRSKGYVDGGADALTIAAAGVAALGAYQPLPTGRALYDHWQGQLGKAEREILRVLFEEWPNARPKDFVAMKAGYAPDGGGFNNALSRLRTLELIEGKAKLRCSDAMHEGA